MLYFALSYLPAIPHMFVRLDPATVSDAVQQALSFIIHSTCENSE